jgi:GrpB-like predicted nucleotidyltransferase (UPF0157 family)
MRVIREIRVVPYDPDWPRSFYAEADALRAILGQEIIAIHHIGSTAIPNLSAKPIIDILVEVHHIEKMDEFDAAMRRSGYLPKGEAGIPGRRFYIKGDEIHRTHHIHIFQAGRPDIERHLGFRDYMIAHPEDAKAYGWLKEELAQRFPTDIEGYMAGKDALIKETDRKARAWKDEARRRPFDDAQRDVEKK